MGFPLGFRDCSGELRCISTHMKKKNTSRLLMEEKKSTYDLKVPLVKVEVKL